MSQGGPSIADLLNACENSAVHLEMRDVYSVAEEIEEFEAWKQGTLPDWDDRDSWWDWYYQAVCDAVGRGAVVRRCRVVSLPATDYIRYEHACSPGNIIAGEQVRWLPRHRATDLALPGNDFWLFDGRRVRVNHFTGEGRVAYHEVVEDAELATLCARAFEAVWQRAIPHEDFPLGPDQPQT